MRAQVPLVDMTGCISLFLEEMSPCGHKCP